LTGSGLTVSDDALRHHDAHSTWRLTPIVNHRHANPALVEHQLDVDRCRCGVTLQLCSASCPMRKTASSSRERLWLTVSP
jgi:hypothetical protein